MKLRSAALFLICYLTTLAQTPPSKNITLIIGKGDLLQFDRDVTRVAIAEPKVADAVVVSPREVMVNAKGPGKTTLVIWEDGGSPMRYDVNVVADTSDLDTLRAEIRSRTPGA